MVSRCQYLTSSLPTTPYVFHKSSSSSTFWMSSVCSFDLGIPGVSRSSLCEVHLQRHKGPELVTWAKRQQTNTLGTSLGQCWKQGLVLGNQQYMDRDYISHVGITHLRIWQPRVWTSLVVSWREYGKVRYERVGGEKVETWDCCYVPSQLPKQSCWITWSTHIVT